MIKELLSDPKAHFKSNTVLFKQVEELEIERGETVFGGRPGDAVRKFLKEHLKDEAPRNLEQWRAYLGIDR